MSQDSWFLIIGLIALGLLLIQTLQLQHLKKLLGRNLSNTPLAEKKISSEGTTSTSTSRDVADEKGIFDQFLDEKPECKLLAKSEQLKQYRQWRRDRGMTWSS